MDTPGKEIKFPSFKFVDGKGGSQYLIVNGFKFREIRQLRLSGLFSFRCTVCSSSLKMDPTKTQIVELKENHNHSVHQNVATPNKIPLDMNSTLDTNDSLIEIDGSTVRDENSLAVDPPTEIINSGNCNVDTEELSDVNRTDKVLRNNSNELKQLMEFKITATELLAKMKITIEVLEADNKVIRNENLVLQSKLNEYVNFYSPGHVEHENMDLANDSSSFIHVNSFQALDESADTHLIETKNLKSPNNRNSNKYSRAQNRIKKQTRIPENNSITMKKIDHKITKSKKLTNKKRLLIMADSHGRDLGWDLNNDLGEYGYEVSVIARPGANFNTVTRDIANFTKDFDFNDRVVVLAGANDVINSTNQPTEVDLQPIVEISKYTKVSISTVPYRYDKPLMNVNVKKLNSWLSEQISNADCLDLLDLAHFEIDDYTRHGLHLNKG
ncbi:uncharacterized protein LOC111059500 isoform X1 [Nilaparvata lugens]|uniref:uncharacterized protein LOC111059500 isoform X1 n=1 Tax=Nilaparvata lugens TaxID=108931 RepID=UPI00193D85FF|nr:uncharacterized protein LOC111059500 isoform X1 [Nilaparvata lugens]